MRIIPVLDLQGGIVVRGVGGRREEYRPLTSRLTNSCKAVAVAHAFRTNLGLTEFYLADLDAIAGKPPGLATVRSLQQQGFHLWVDAGLRRASMAEALATYGVEGIVAGLETLTGPEELGRLVGALGHRVIFSLDLRSGLPLGSRAWESTLPLDIVGKAIQEGVKRILVLDLARVGKGSGTGTESLCQEIALQYPEVELTAGGGVRSTQDLECLKKVGVQAVLVASGLHDCQITRQDLDHFREASTR